MKRILVVLLIVMLAGCADPTPIMGDGNQAMPPAGWLDYCHRHPRDVDCQAK